MSTGSYFKLNPSDKLEFKLEEGKVANARTTITNTSSYSSNDRNRFSVKPSSFILSPGEQNEITYNIKIPNVDAMINKVKEAGQPEATKDKFQILGLKCGRTFLENYNKIQDPRTQQDVIARQWKTAADSDQSMSILRVNYVYPENLFKTEPDRPANEESLPLKAEQDVNALNDKYNDLMLQFNNINDQKDTQAKAIQGLNETIKKLRATIDKLTEEKEVAQKQVESAKDAVATAKPSNVNLISIAILVVSIVIAYFIGRKSH